MKVLARAGGIAALGVGVLVGPADRAAAGSDQVYCHLVGEGDNARYVCEVKHQDPGNDGDGGNDGGDDDLTPADQVRIEQCNWIANNPDEVGGVPEYCVIEEDPGAIAQRIWETLPEMPEIVTGPPRGSDAAVGLPVWVWAEPEQWRVITKRGQAGPVWAEVVATPTTITIRPGDGSVVTCDGPGKPYAPNTKSPCSHAYQRSSAGLPGTAYQMTVVVRWTGTWTGSGGTGGVLPPIDLDITFDVQVAEGQALN